MIVLGLVILVLLIFQGDCTFKVRHFFAALDRSAIYLRIFLYFSIKASYHLDASIKQVINMKTCWYSLKDLVETLLMSITKNEPAHEFGTYIICK